MKFIVQIAVTYNYEIPVEADDINIAQHRAMELWNKADVIDQWEIPDQSADVVAIIPQKAHGK